MARYFLYCLFLICQIVISQNHCLAQAVNIKGKVRGDESLLPFATVTLDNKTVFTDQQGEFKFLVNPGIYTLIITHTGYKKIEQQVRVDSTKSQSFEFNMAIAGLLDEVVLLSSRSLIQRSSLNTMVPVDVFTSTLLKQTGQISLTQMLNFSAPSVNASRELLNEPVTFRGLDPNHILILVNGFRYHNMAFVFPGAVRGILGKGSVSNDINSIPFPAIEKIEILRDGASAQYGSDAIAGVMNIQLNNSIGKTSIALHNGQYYKGDGETITLGINHGIHLNKKGLPDARQGFLNFSADLRFRNHTYRGGEFTGYVYKNIGANAIHADSIIIRAEDDSIIAARNFNRKNTGHAGNTKLKALGFLINGGYPVGNHTELFWMAAIYNRQNIFINPYTFPKMIRVVNDDLYPDGFKSLSRQNSGDISGIAGAKGETRNNWHWEFGMAYGKNIIDYYTDNTNNASQYFTLGKYAPTSFYTGTNSYQQLTNNINFTKTLSKKNGRLALTNAAFGAEWRLENYQIKAGEEAAWQTYDSRKSGGAQGALIFQPDDVVNGNRNALGTYIDLEAELKDHLSFGFAGRYEYYSDFGNSLTGKLAIRYKLSDQFSLRGSISNGFRAPSLQQRYFSSTIRAPGNTSLITGYFPNNSGLAVAFGVPSLDAEKSVNLSGGFTSTILKQINLTVDAYWIQIKDRIVLSGRYDSSNREVDSLFRTYKLKVDAAQFFANAINTRTQGIDVVLSSSWKIHKARLAIMFAANFTQTKLFGEIKVARNLTPDSLNTNTLFNRTEKTRIEKGQPRDKIILSLNYTIGKLAFLFRNTHFGKTELVSFRFPNDTTLDESFSSRILSDISISYTPKKWLTITAGANNVFNVYPDRFQYPRNTESGILVYSLEASPFGFNGGYYYVNMSFNF